MGVKLEKLIEKMNLKNLTPDLDLTQSEIQVPDINRPALQLTGYFDHFDSERVQIIGFDVHSASFLRASPSPSHKSGRDSLYPIP